MISNRQAARGGHIPWRWTLRILFKHLYIYISWNHHLSLQYICTHQSIIRTSLIYPICSWVNSSTSWKKTPSDKPFRQRHIRADRFSDRKNAKFRMTWLPGESGFVQWLCWWFLMTIIVDSASDGDDTFKTHALLIMRITSPCWASSPATSFMVWLSPSCIGCGCYDVGNMAGVIMTSSGGDLIKTHQSGGQSCQESEEKILPINENASCQLWQCAM